MPLPQLSVVDYDDIYEDLIQSDEDLKDNNACQEYLKNSPLPCVQDWMEQSKTNPAVLDDILQIIDCYLKRPINADD